jgi:spore germination protein GerM
MIRVVAACLGMILLTGCGIPVQDQPVGIAPADVPSALRGDPASQPPVPPTVDPTSAKVLVYFVRAEQLVGLPRKESGGSPDERVRTALAALIAGPNERERAAGITTALPPELGLAISAVEGQRAVLTVDGETGGSSTVDNILTVGQVVLSLTSVPSIHEVAFVRDGAPVEALLPGGALTADPLTAADYGKLKAT